MPVTWCYTVEKDLQHCTTGFPMGCYIDRDLHVKDSCGLIDPKYRTPDTYYLFNHVDLTITYHSGRAAEWGQIFGASSGRIICKNRLRLYPKFPCTENCHAYCL